MEGVQNHAGEGGDDVNPNSHINQAVDDANLKGDITLNGHVNNGAISRFGALTSDTEEDLANAKETLGVVSQQNIIEAKDNSKKVGHTQSGKSSVSNISNNNKVRNNHGGRNPQNKSKNNFFGNKPAHLMIKKEPSPLPVLITDNMKSNENVKENERSFLRRMKEMPAANVKFMDFLDAHTVHVNKEAVEFVMQARKFAEGSLNPKPPDKEDSKTQSSNMVIDSNENTLTNQIESMMNVIAVGNGDVSSQSQNKAT
ncbi:hypothetical protein RIF29_04703 [Crotalaria pallida]|uniref:Uncharacterized protein n=1 Tax=Crotalaria pallida TaxID=3830 RepID=A0AAN9J226_CROPI